MTINKKHCVSVICPVYNEGKYIEECIVSVINQDYPKDYLEVFFIDGMSHDNTRTIIKQYNDKYPYIKLLDNVDRIVPPALNIGILASQGDVIIRIDGHCTYPKNYFSVLVEKLFELDNAENVGALLKTMPVNNSSKALAIAITSSHRFGVGSALCRVGVDKIIATDTVPFGCFKADIFRKIGMFDNDLIRNQDDEFNARIIKHGGKIYLIPELVIEYFARDKISKMAKMFYQYGLFKPLVNKKLGGLSTTRQLFPLLFLLGVIFGGILSVFSQMLLWIYFGVLGFYFLLGILFGIRSAIKNRNWKLVFLLPVTFFVVHLSYGWGYLKGIFKFMIRGKSQYQVDINR